MKILIKNANVISSELETPKVFDVLISDGKISEISQNIQSPGVFFIDAEGKILVPGLVDAHVHFREPGQEYKEDLHTGSSAAAAGGFTTVIAEPNTVPAIDTPKRLRNLLDSADKKSIVNFYSKATISIGSMGNKLTDVVKLKENGARAISDDGNPVPSQRLMGNALAKGKECGILVNPHCEESETYRARIIKKQKKLGPPSFAFSMPYAPPGAGPYTSEAGFVQRDIELAEKANARIHISHVSLARSVEIIANAKKRGVKVTAEATPHHLLLTERMAEEIGSNAKVNPPLRSEEDVAAVREGLANGMIDIVASDHAPHSPEEKNQEWEKAPFGVIGLETTLGLILTYLVRPGILTLSQAIKKMTIMPARIFGLDVLGIGSLKVGTKADLTLIDLDKKWKVDVSRFYSKGRNCPFNGWDLEGKAVLTMVGGRIVAKDGGVL